MGVYLAALETLWGFCQVTPGVLTARLAYLPLCLTRLARPEPVAAKSFSWASRSYILKW